MDIQNIRDNNSRGHCICFNVSFCSIQPQQTQTKVAINNNRKPVFKDCSRYAPVVKEEADADTEVLRVEAFDADRDDIIVYAFIVTPGERQKFNINNVTGVITTRQVRPLLSFIYLVSDEQKFFRLEKLLA
jgi:hypothetical protein